MTTSTKCRAKNPAACIDPNCPEKRAGTAALMQEYTTSQAATITSDKAQIAKVSASYKAWREGDMEDNAGRIDRANAYMAAVANWACGVPITESSMSSDTGSEIVPCRLKANHAGKHDPHATYPWMR